MAVFVVIVAYCLALTVVQLDMFVTRNQPLAILQNVTALLPVVFLIVVIVFDFYFVINFVCLVLQRYGGLLQFANFLTLFLITFIFFLL